MTNIPTKHPVVFITGGSRGIGKAIVDKFHAQQWLTAACATTEQSANDCHADLNIVCDVGKVDHVRAAIKKILTTFGRLDAVINNAGIAGPSSFDPDIDDQLWQKILDTNLNGTYFVSKYALPHLPDHSGRIINIASVLGLKGVADRIAYCAAKHGVVGFTKALALFAAPRRITVNAICPGWTRTDMAHTRMEEINLTEADLDQALPLGRFIEPKEIADLAFYLATSPGANNMTGAVLTVDGGYLA
jgi:NAD(P)-dependent dehydrogenase (short-subunit alcohol dehydrogenase family)